MSNYFLYIRVFSLSLKPSLKTSLEALLRFAFTLLRFRIALLALLAILTLLALRVSIALLSLVALLALLTLLTFLVYVPFWLLTLLALSKYWCVDCMERFSEIRARGGSMSEHGS